MKLFRIVALFAIIAGVTPSIAANKVEFKSQRDSISYTVGTNWGEMMKSDSLYLNTELLKAGIEDALAGGKMALTDEEMATCFKELSQQINDRKQRIQAEKGAAAKAAGVKFLAENGKKAGVKTTASGLQYEVITPGDPAKKKPTAASKVKVHYEGKLLNGKVFDSSYERKEPIEFQLSQVIPGWTEGVQLMSEGAKYKFYIPSELAYGSRGAGNDIGPDETLVFTVELLEVQSNPAK